MCVHACGPTLRELKSSGEEKRSTPHAMQCMLLWVFWLDLITRLMTPHALHPPSEFPMGCTRWTRGAVRRRTGGAWLATQSCEDQGIRGAKTGRQSQASGALSLRERMTAEAG